MAIKKRYSIAGTLILLLLIGLALFLWAIYVSPPTVNNKSALEQARLKISTTHYQVGNNFLRQNEQGIWEMYVEGNAFERGVAIGHLSKELLAFQEAAFVNGVYEMLPTGFMLHFLKYVVAWQNRKLADHIAIEYQKEIYGMSGFASDDYDYIGPKFQRKLFYHAAHDIGHTVQNMGLVGCSAFSVWGENAADGQILSGRNFDFYVGEDFRKNKMILFMRPNTGYAFASYAWPGMIGVLSGMNEKGLSISLNAGPPEMPSDSKTPVSILAREILQYASSIQEAVDIAKKRSIFVSESFLISSAIDNKSVIIEKTADTTIVVQSVQQALICTNHFQSVELKSLSSNRAFKDASSTTRRYKRMRGLIESAGPINDTLAIEILRDRGNPSERTSGIGNEENINIMLSHHSVLFQPAQKLIWISAGEDPMQGFIAYSLDRIFGHAGFRNQHQLKENGSIAASSWVQSDDYKKYLLHRSQYERLVKDVRYGINIQASDFDEMIANNKDLYKGYFLAGNYFADQGNCALAKMYFEQALEKVIPWQKDINEIESQLSDCKS